MSSLLKITWSTENFNTYVFSELPEKDKKENLRLNDGSTTEADAKNYIKNEETIKQIIKAVKTALTDDGKFADKFVENVLNATLKETGEVFVKTTSPDPPPGGGGGTPDPPPGGGGGGTPAPPPPGGGGGGEKPSDIKEDYSKTYAGAIAMLTKDVLSSETKDLFVNLTKGNLLEAFQNTPGLSNMCANTIQTLVLNTATNRNHCINLINLLNNAKVDSILDTIFESKLQGFILFWGGFIRELNLSHFKTDGTYQRRLKKVKSALSDGDMSGLRVKLYSLKEI